MQLFVTATSPFARKARVAARELALSVEEIVVDPLADDSRLLAVSPLGRVPVLVAPEGPIQDSRVIVRYFERAAGVPPDAERALADDVLEAVSDGLMDVAVSVVMERRRSPDETSPGFVDRQLRRLARTLDALALPSSTEPSRGVVALACALGYLGFRLPELLWRERRDDLADWYAAVARRPSMQATMPPTR